MIKAIKLATVPVRDHDRALKFWTEAVGLQVVTDQQFGKGMRWIELQIPGAQTRLALFTPPGAENLIGTMSNLSFMSDNVERTHQELAAKGVEFAKKPTKESWGTSAIFKDPDGNSFNLSSR